MSRKSDKKERAVKLRGGQLLARGDAIRLMDKGALINCRVLSCLAGDGDTCLASLEILEGDRKGERIETLLRLKDPTFQ